MTALAVGDWTTTINKTIIKGGQRETHCTLTYGDGSLTYPTAGIPFPTAAQLGMQRNVDAVYIVDSALDAATTTAHVYGWDKSNNLLKIYLGGGAATILAEDGGNAIAATTLEVVVQGW